MRMMRFLFSISHVPGKSLTVADTLSRAPLEEARDCDRLLQEEAAVFVSAVIQSLPATEERLEEIRRHQQQDDVCQLLTSYCQSGWPDKNLPEATRPY